MSSLNKHLSSASSSAFVDHESLVSQITHQLSEREEEDTVVGGSDLVFHCRPSPESVRIVAPLHSTSSNNSVMSREADKVEGNNRLAHVDDERIQCLDSARSSFSIALEECQERRYRSNAQVNKRPERSRQGSVDFNNPMSSISSTTNLSPRIGGSVKNTGTVFSKKTSNFPSPGTLSYGHCIVGVNKGWRSERVPLSRNGNGRHVGGASSAALLPFNSGRTLPSKWEDAERWIFSPVAGDGAIRTSYQQPQRRPKSKSGPLGPLGIASYSMYSPTAAPVFYEGNNMNNFLEVSPISTGVIGVDVLSMHNGGDSGPFATNRGEPCIARSASVHGCTDLVCQSSAAMSQDESLDDLKGLAANTTCAVSRRDMATQMSPACGSNSSPKRRSFFSPSMKAHTSGSFKTDVRDVQVDERVTVTKWSKQHKSRTLSRTSDDVDDWGLKAVRTPSSSWQVPETAKNISKAKREEARINAWENLQKAKAEAAIRKLEMKLEKIRFSSMDKIMNKLRSAQKKAHEMRSEVLASQAPRESKPSHRSHQMGYVGGCFSCDTY